MKRQIFPDQPSRRIFLLLALLLLCANSAVLAQTTTFTYQGRLTDGGTPATGIYDLQFALFDSPSSGGQIGSSQTLTNVSVSNGIFSVSLDFGANAFSGANRFLEIGARPANSGSFTVLTPRQQITSTPYAVRSLGTTVADGLSSACTGCVQDTNINAVAGSKVSGAIPVAGIPAGSTSYVQNTNSPQASSNFSISGNGTAGGTLSADIVRATTQYNLAGFRAFSLAGSFNTFVGAGTGLNNTGSSNAFFGSNAGLANSNGSGNSFFGSSAGNNNTTGTGNSFFGNRTGQLTTTGDSNSFFGDQAGLNNTASDNSFFGRLAGSLNSTGSFNSFFGSNAGLANTTATGNSFFGASAGKTNTSGSQNSFFGFSAGQANTTGVHNSFFGFLAGEFNSTGRDNTFVGWASGSANTIGGSNSFFGMLAGGRNTEGTLNSSFGYSAGGQNATGSFNSFFGENAGVNNTVDGNSFFGSSAGKVNTTGSRNAFFGRLAGAANTTGQDNSFFGSEAGALSTTSNGNAFFGSSAGGLSTGDRNAFFGNGTGYNSTGSANAFFGHFTGNRNTTGAANTFLGETAGFQNTTGGNNTFVGWGAGDNNTTGSNNTIIGEGANVSSADLDHATAIGADAVVGTSNTIVLGRANGSDFVKVWGFLTIPNLAAAGMTQLCRNAFDRIGDCSSSLRYKTNLAVYGSGLSVIDRLRPISFTWKDGGMRDVGFGAEDVEKIDPLLVTYNKQGQVEGVKYDRINVVLVNAIKQQQDQIEALRAANASLNARLRGIEKALRKSIGTSSRRRH